MKCIYIAGMVYIVVEALKFHYQTVLVTVIDYISNQPLLMSLLKHFKALQTWFTLLKKLSSEDNYWYCGGISRSGRHCPVINPGPFVLRRAKC